VEKDPSGLCGAFVPRVASNIGGASNHGSCIRTVASIFRNDDALKSFPEAPLVKTFLVGNVAWRGDKGKATISYYVKEGRARFQLAFIKADSRWRVSTAPILTVVGGCRVYIERRRCSRAGDVLFFGVAEPVVSGIPRIAPPPAVRRRGGSDLREFEAGSRIAVDSGCLACHRIGIEGKDAPGPALTHVGDMLSPGRIAAAIITPTAPMPSFRNLQKAKLASLVKFLSLLK
jgi:hypothetical protein